MILLQSIPTKLPAKVSLINILALTILCVVVLLPRVLPFPQIFFTDDEMQIGRWTSQMTTALFAGDWQNTANNAYPAVTLAWIEAVQVELTQLLPGPSIMPEQMVSDADKDVFAALFRRRFALALINTGLILATFWLLGRLYNNFVAVSTTLLMALDPFLLTQSRVFRTEGLTTGLMLLGALTIILYAKERRWYWLVVSGILGGLATLTKITSIFLLLFVGLTLLAWPLMLRQREVIPLLKRTTRDVILWSLVMGLTFFIFWPALWVAPIETFYKVYNYVHLAATNIETVWGGADSAIFFRGQILREDPGILFYLWSLAYRITPIALLGLVIIFGGILLLFLQRWRSSDWTPFSPQLLPPYLAVTWLILAYVIFYFLAMSLGASKWDRYLVPIFPGISILAAVGFQVIVDMFSGSGYAARVKWGLWGIILVSSAWVAIPQHPYYFTYWNPLLGGGREGVKVLPAGGRPGINMMVEYLNSLPNAAQLNLAGPGLRDCPAIFVGNCLQSAEFPLADYIVGDLFSLQKNVYLSNVEEIIPKAELVRKYTKDGVDYAWLYKIPDGLRQTEQWLGDHGKLRGYGFSATEVGAGDRLGVAIFWINGEGGWTLDNSVFFVKLMDENGQMQQIALTQPRNGFDPRSSEAGDMLVFDAFFDLPPDLLLGSYHVEIGLRLKATGEETWIFSLDNSNNKIVVNRGAINVPLETLSMDHHVEQAVGETGLTLLGYDDLTNDESPRFDFYWQTEQALPEEYILQLTLLNPRGQAVATWRDKLSSKIHPATDWQPGEIIKLSFPLVLGYTLPMDRYHPVLSILPINHQDADPFATISLAPLPAGFMLERPTVNMQHLLDEVRFGQYVDLLGYDLRGQKNSEGGSLFVALYWLNRDPFEPVEAEIQVLDEQGEVVGQVLVPIPAATDTFKWRSVSQTELTLSGLPATIIIKTRPVGASTWHQVQHSVGPVTEQVIIEDVLQKIAPVVD